MSPPAVLEALLLTCSSAGTPASTADVVASLFGGGSVLQTRQRREEQWQKPLVMLEENSMRHGWQN